MKKPIVDETLCFICQEQTPTHTVIRDNEKFTVCSDCAKLIENENKIRNRIKSAINLSDTRGIFRMTLGVDLLPVKIKIEPHA